MAEKKSKNVKEIKVEIKGEKWTKAIDDAFNKVIKTIKIDGFRPGKAPRSVYEKKYGKQSLVIEAVDQMMNEAYKEALKKYKDTPILTPQVTLDKADSEGVVYNFIFISKPEVKINKYKNLGVKKQTVKVSQKEVLQQIEKAQKEYADLAVKEGKIEKGDTAVIDFEGFENGQAFDGGKGENYPLEIGSNSFIPGFEDALIGLSSGDEKDINISFPKDYPAENLKGKPVVFKVKVHEVKTKVYPELDSEFFKDLGYDDIKTVDELKEKIKDGMTAQKKYEAENKYVDDLFDALLKETKVELPEELIHEEVHEMVHQYEDRLKMQGLTLDQFFKYTNSSMESLENQMKDDAEKRVKLRFAIDEIIKLENINATDDEVSKEIEIKSKEHNMTEEEFVKAFGGNEMIKYDIKVQKVIELLK